MTADPKEQRIGDATPVPVSPSLDGESYTVRRFVLDHCAAIGAEYEADFRADLLRMLAEVRAEQRSEAASPGCPACAGRCPHLGSFSDGSSRCGLLNGHSGPHFSNTERYPIGPRTADPLSDIERAFHDGWAAVFASMRGDDGCCNTAEDAWAARQRRESPQATSQTILNTLKGPKP